MIFYRII